MELNYMGSGKVYFNNKDYRCDLYSNDSEGGVLIKINLPNATASYFALPLRINFLVGQLSTGFKFSLITCKRQGMSNNISEGRSVYTYHSSYLVKGVGEKTDKCFKLNTIDFRVNNILAWGGISAYKISDNFELSHNHDAKIEVYKNDEFIIEYWVGNTMLPVVPSHLLKQNIVLNQSAHISITFQNESSIDKFEEVFNKIKRLIEISTIRYISPSKLIGMSNIVYDMYDEIKVERAIEIISSELSNEETKEELTESMRWINLSELIENDSVSNYFLKYELLEPVIELYLEIIYSKAISTRRVFLNIVQSLETYHSRFKSNKLSDFKSRIKTKILKKRPEIWIEKDRTFLMANSKYFITLESRLADLLLAEFQIHFDTGDIDYYDFPKVIANTRNYYVHYDESIRERGQILSESELSIYNKALIYILEYYILIELGFPESLKISEKLNDRWGRISETISIIKLSDENENNHK